MSFQKCPTCDGCGYIGVGFPTGTPCPTCGGHRIIHEQTGQPPATKKTYATSTTIDLKEKEK